MQLSCEQTVDSPEFPVFRYKELLDKMTETDDSGVIYPERDGKPIGETEFHVMAIIELCQALRHYSGNPAVQSAGKTAHFFRQNRPVGA